MTSLEAVHAYFDGERRELLAMLAGSVLSIVATASLLFVARDGFARGLFAVVLIVGVVFGGGAVSLLARDAGLRNDNAAALRRGPTESAAALDREIVRVEAVLSKFSVYRKAALAIAVLAVGGLLAARGGRVHGIAAGLLLVAASQAVIDHYAEARADRYLHDLAASRTG